MIEGDPSTLHVLHHGLALKVDRAAHRLVVAELAATVVELVRSRGRALGGLAGGLGVDVGRGEACYRQLLEGRREGERESGVLDGFCLNGALEFQL